MSAGIVLFALDDLRARYGGLVAPEADPRHDTSPFRAFRETLLAELARRAHGAADLTMWWEGGYNGYALAVAVDPADAVPDLGAAAAAACPVDAERVGRPREDRYVLGRVAPGRFEVIRTDGATFEAPFGAATGHFGAPGMRRIP
jgi:hypothetical protein